MTDRNPLVLMFLLVILWTNMQWQLFRRLSCSESGRALGSHHSVVIFEAVSSSKYTVPTMGMFGMKLLGAFRSFKL
ncbi:putative arginine decarboxylase [Helianthus anomalus]